MKTNEISKADADKFRKFYGDDLELHSTFTHCEGVSHLSRYWTEIETNYYCGPLLFKILTTRETKDSSEITRYFIEINRDYFEE